MLGGLLAGGAEAALLLLRVSGPRGPRVLAPARPAAPGLRRGARRASTATPSRNPTRRWTQIVADTAKALKPEDVLIVLSDHGFATWRRSVNYNSWLVENGYLVLKGSAKRQNLEALFSRGQFWEAVDWSKSKAYAMGLGDIYVNLKGREADGVVAPGAEYEALRTELIDAPDGSHRPEERRASRLARLQARGRLQALRPAADPRPDRRQPAGLPRLVAVLSRRAHRQRLRGQPRRLERRPLLARSRIWCAASSSRRRLSRRRACPGIADVTASVRTLVGGPAGRGCGGEIALVRRVGSSLAALLLIAAPVTLPGSHSRRLRPAGRSRATPGRGSAPSRRAWRTARRRKPRSPKSCSASSCKLEIATREGELVAATREEFARRLAAVTRRARRRVGVRGRVPPPAGRARAPPAALRALRVLPRAARGEGPAGLPRLDRAARQPRPPRRAAARPVPVRRGAPGREPRARAGAQGRDRPPLHQGPAGGDPHGVAQGRAREAAGARAEHLGLAPARSLGADRQGHAPRAPARDPLAPDRGRRRRRALGRHPALEGRPRLARARARSSRRSAGTATRSSTRGRCPTASPSPCPSGRPSARCMAARPSTRSGWRSTATSSSWTTATAC